MNTWFQWAQVALEFLRIVTAWPVVAGILVVVFFFTFKSGVASILQRFAGLRFPGGVEVTLSQAQSTEVEQAVRKVEAESRADARIAEADSMKSVTANLDSERTRATLWEFRYLNYYLVPITQWVLEQVAAQSASMNLSTYDAWLLPIVQDARERSAILAALTNHHLLSMSGDSLITITDKGRAYLSWRGKLQDVVKFWMDTRGRSGNVPGAPPPASM
jgi:hypothetical protein